MSSSQDNNNSDDSQTFEGFCSSCESPVIKTRYSVQAFLRKKWYIEYSCEWCGHYSHIKE